MRVDCEFCAGDPAEHVCDACGRVPVAGGGDVDDRARASAARLCLGLEATVPGVRRREVVAAVGKVLAEVGVGRAAAAPVAAALRALAEVDVEVTEIEALLPGLWGYAREVVLGTRGEPLGTFELPADELAAPGAAEGVETARVTRRVDRHPGTGHVSFTVVQDRVSGTGLVGVWDAEGKLWWAPPRARDLRFVGNDEVIVLFDTHLEWRAWPSRELRQRRAVQQPGCVNVRVAVSPRKRIVSVLSFEAARSATYFMGSIDAPGRPECVGGDAPAATDVVFDPAERIAVVASPGVGEWWVPVPGFSVCQPITLTIENLATGRRTLEVVDADVTAWVPDDLVAAGIVEPPVFVADDVVEVRLPWGATARIELGPRHFVERLPERPAWVEGERARLASAERASKVSVVGDWGRAPCADTPTFEAPEDVDFAPIPVVSVGRSPDRAFLAFTMRPEIGRLPTGLNRLAFPSGGSGVSAIWERGTGALVRVLDEPGEVRWLSDAEVLVFHARALELRTWPAFEVQWRIPLATPFEDGGGAGHPVPCCLEVSPRGDVAVLAWERLHDRGGQRPGFAYELVDLRPTPVQRPGGGFHTKSANEIVRGPTWSENGRFLAFSVGQPCWHWVGAEDVVFRGPSSFVILGAVYLHDLIKDRVRMKRIETKTPPDFKPLTFRGVDVLGAPVFEGETRLALESPLGDRITLDLAAFGEEKSVPRAPPPRAPLRKEIRTGWRESFGVPFEVPPGLGAVERPFARRVSWSGDRSRVLLALAPDAASATTFAGIWDARTGALVVSMRGAQSATFTPRGDALFELGPSADVSMLGFPSLGAVAFRSYDVGEDIATPDGKRVVLCSERKGEVSSAATLDQELDIVYRARARNVVLRGPVFSDDGRHACFAVLSAEEQRAALADLVVLDFVTGRAREVEVPRPPDLVLDLAAGMGQLDLRAEGLVVLSAGERVLGRWRLAELAPGDETALLPIPLFVPSEAGAAASDEADAVPWDRLQNGVSPLHAAMWSLPHHVAARFHHVAERFDEEVDLVSLEEAMLGAALFDDTFPPHHLGPSVVASLPFLAAQAADDAMPGRASIAGWLGYALDVATATGDARTLEAFTASLAWLQRGGATSPALRVVAARVSALVALR